jgi:GxxExxY protein
MAVLRHTALYLNRITSAIIAAAIEVHRRLGSGPLESAYRKCLVIELQGSGFRSEQKRRLPLIYKGVRVTPTYEADVIVEDCVIVEVKAVEALHPIHEQQLMTYLRLSGCRVGLVLNFGGATLKSGIRRVVNNFPADSEKDSDAGNTAD